MTYFSLLWLFFWELWAYISHFGHLFVASLIFYLTVNKNEIIIVRIYIHIPAILMRSCQTRWSNTNPNSLNESYSNTYLFCCFPAESCNLLEMEIMLVSFFRTVRWTYCTVILNLDSVIIVMSSGAALNSNIKNLFIKAMFQLLHFVLSL